MPAHLEWYVRFATTRIVIAYGPRSKHADSLNAENWWRILSRPGVAIGRGDSLIAPVGRHGLAVLRRAEMYYAQAGLARRLLANSPNRLMRPNAAELAALLETGEVDYALDYESVAKQHGFRYLTLPPDLADAVLYGVAVPSRAANRAGGEEFVAFMLSGDGLRVLRDAGVELLRLPVAMGTNVPAEIAERVRTLVDAR
jgi:ABC-type molybdate transport system substrate-binding protein